MERQELSHGSQPHSKIEKGYETLVKDKADNIKSISVLVGGAYCAACIYKIENAVRKEPCVTYVRLNFSTGLLSIEWRGENNLSNDFIQSIEDLGYTVRPYDMSLQKESSDRDERFLLMCLGVAGFAAGNIMLLSVGLWATDAQTMGMATRDFMHWVSALIAIPTIAFSGRPFFRSAFAAVRSGHTNMDVPISVGLILTGGISLFETINHGEHAYFDSAVMLIFFLLIGRYCDFRARKKVYAGATDLLQSLSGFATVIENGKSRHVLIADIKEGDVILVSAGEKFPADGKISEGTSEVDVSLVTGETIPAPVTQGSFVYAGTINISAPLVMVVSKAVENSLLADIVRLMDKAGQTHARYVRIADRAARIYTPAVHTLALMTYLVWWGMLGASWQHSMMIAITVLIITCPCALGLAVPVVQVLATGRLMRNGILVKSGDALERLAGIDRILMDKTGTLTLGKPVLIDNDIDKDHLKLAASLAIHSNHPLSRSLAASYQGDLYRIEDLQEHPGLGLQGTVEGKSIRLGSRTWCGIEMSGTDGYMELWLDQANASPLCFKFTDKIRPDGEATIQKFQREGLHPVLLSGDRETVVQNIARQCGIETYRAGLSPKEKFSYMEDLTGQGRSVLMIGDGLNDAPVLAGANVSIAPGTAIALSQNAADIVFQGERLDPVYQAYKTATMAQKIVRQNFALAVIYNIIAIPVAAFGFLTPFLAAIAMSGSSLIVILNSFRVRS